MGTHIREAILRKALRFIHARDRRKPDEKRIGTRAIKRILAISCTAIGDTLLSTPALRSLRLAYPHAHIALLLNQNYVSLFSNNPDIDEIVPYAGGYKRFFRLAWALRQQRFDIALILHGNEPQATPLAYLSGAEFRFKLPNDNDFCFLLSNAEPILHWDDFTHGIDQRLAVAALAGGIPTERKMTLSVSPAASDTFAARLASKSISPSVTLIGLQTGASTISRRWPLERFAELGKRLLNRAPDCHIVLTGSPAERGLNDNISRLIHSPRIWNAAGELSLSELPALMQRVRLLVTGDTGPMHMAIAVGTPVVAFFAVSNWKRPGPAYDFDKHTVIQKWRTCNPCQSKRCPYAEPLCMDNISIEEVELAVTNILEGRPGKISEASTPE